MLGIFVDMNNKRKLNSKDISSDNENNEINRKLRKKQMKLLHKIEFINIDSFIAIIELLNEVSI